MFDLIALALLLPGLLFLLAVVSLGAIRRPSVARRPRAGICSRCRYDLTGNVSGKCPECGQQIKPRRGNSA